MIVLSAIVRQNFVINSSLTVLWSMLVQKLCYHSSTIVRWNVGLLKEITSCYSMCPRGPTMLNKQTNKQTDIRGGSTIVRFSICKRNRVKYQLPYNEGDSKDSGYTYSGKFWIYLYFRIRHSFARLRPVILSADWSISRLQSWTCSSLSTVAEFVKLTQSFVIEIQRQSADLYKVQLCNRQFLWCPHRFTW